MGAFPFVAPPVGLSAQSAACLPSGLRRQPLLSLPGPGKRCTASFSPRGFESNLIGYNQTAAPPLWVALLFGSPCWTRTNDTPQFAIVALRRRKRLPCARCSLGFRLAPPRTAGARLRPVNSRDPADAQSRCPGQPAGDTKGKAPSWVPFLLWLPLLDSPLNPRPACPPGCAGNRSFRYPAPENDAPHRFLLGASSPTSSGTTKQQRHPFGWRCCLAPPVGLEPTTLRLTAACSTD